MYFWYITYATVVGDAGLCGINGDGTSARANLAYPVSS